MGYAQIIGGGEDGLYTVALDYGIATRDAWVAAIDGWIERLNIEIADAEATLVVARDRTAAAEAELQALIGLLSSGGGPDGSAATMARIDIATAKYAQALAAQDAVRIPRDQRIAERKTLVAKKGAVLAALVQETRQAWCVDLTENATGYVATIEVPGEDQSILIAPRARAPTQADGALTARELTTPEQAFFSAAILPGWQKWKPMFRKGTILDVDRDSGIATVSLDAATSSAQQLPVNQSATLSNVPVIYMECNAKAFESGDRVIVEFVGQDWSAPQVIGFVDHPKPCIKIRVYYAVGGSEVFDEEFYQGDTAPGFTAPATIDGANELGATIAMPFVGWSDGESNIAHPEFELGPTPTIYYINAEYAGIGARDEWNIATSHDGNQDYFDTYTIGDTTFVDGYVRSGYTGVLTCNQAASALSVLGATSVNVPVWFTDWFKWWTASFGPGETVTYPSTAPPTQPVSLDGPQVSDYVPTSYSVTQTLSSGWQITRTYSAVVDTTFFAIHYPVSITASPP